MSPDEQSRLIENLIGSLKNVPEFIQERMVKHFHRLDPEYGKGVAKGLGLSVS
jgi:catalase